LEVLAEIVVLLHSSGTHSARIMRNIERIAKGLGYNVELVLTFNGIVVSIYKDNAEKKYTLSKSIKLKGINFETVSEISILSWDVLENRISLHKIKLILKDIKQKVVYQKWSLYSFISLSSAALCVLFNGDLLEAFIAFIATFIGFGLLRFFKSQGYNTFFSVFLVTLVSVSIIHVLGVLFNVKVVEALAVSVLYLVPGVFLINSFIDYLESFIEAGSSKLIYSFLVIAAIASGFFFSNYLFSKTGYCVVFCDLSSLQNGVTLYSQNLGLALMSSKFILGGITSLGFAILFNTPKRALWVVFLLGGLGFMMKYYLNIELNFVQILSVFCASCFVGISGMYFAHRTHTPPLVFTIPAVINMIPGLLSYKFMVGMINWIMEPNGTKQSVTDVIQTFNFGITAIFIVFALAFGVAISVIVFKNHSVKGNDLNRLIKLYFKRK
ncbi:MAG: threonine/serine exporter family protein, partial [Flavobacterium sp.]